MTSASEAKTKFPGLCDQVVRSGTPLLVKRRGKPLVVISPASQANKQDEHGILDSLKRWEAQHPQSKDEASDFPEVWTMRHDRNQSPLED